MSEDRTRPDGPAAPPSGPAPDAPGSAVPYVAPTGRMRRPVGTGGSVRTGKGPSADAESGTVDAPTDVLATAGAVSASATAGPAGRSGSDPLGRSPGRPVRLDPPAAPGRVAAKRRARLAVGRVDPWSVFVLSLLISLFLGVVLIVAVFVLYSLLDSLGVLSSVTTFARDLQIIGADQSIVSLGRVLGVAAVLAAVDVVLLTALATFGAFLYNICASITGGVEVVLAERD